LAGVEAADGVAMMLGVHGGEEVGGGFMPGFVLPCAPVHEQTVTQTPEPADDPHGLGQAYAALLVAVRFVEEGATETAGQWAALVPDGVRRPPTGAVIPRDGRQPGNTTLACRHTCDPIRRFWLDAIDHAGLPAPGSHDKHVGQKIDCAEIT